MALRDTSIAFVVGAVFLYLANAPHWAYVLIFAAAWLANVVDQRAAERHTELMEKLDRIQNPGRYE